MSKRSFGPSPFTPEQVQEQAARSARLPDECALALGIYMGDWSHLELATGNLAAVIFGTEEFLGHMLADRMQPAPLRELLTLAASNYMNDHDYGCFGALAEKWKTASGLRNRVVHGQWRINLFLDGSDPTYSRFSHVWDHETAAREADGTHQASKPLRAKNTFSVARIKEESAFVLALASEINQFAATCILRKRPDTLQQFVKSDEHPTKSETDRPLPSTNLINVQHIRGW